MPCMRNIRQQQVHLRSLHLSVLFISFRLVTSGNTAVADNEWGHLQLDATSLYLLMLGEMTSSGRSESSDDDES